MSDPITYTVQSGDGQQFGPYPAKDVQSWIHEGRILPDQQMTRSDLQQWFRAGDFSEFAWPATSSAAATMVPTYSPMNVQTETPTPGGGKFTLDQINPVSLAGIRNAASWFFWIAGLSAVNFVLSLSGSNFSIALGSIAVSACADLARAEGEFRAGFVVTGILIIGLWALLGVLARRAFRSAFIIGMGLYALDALLLMLSFSIVSAVIHAWVLYKIFDGLKDTWALRKAMNA